MIGNGIAGAENQCIGLVRALGLSGNYTLHVNNSLFELTKSNLNLFELVDVNYAGHFSRGVEICYGAFHYLFRNNLRDELLLFCCFARSSL